MNKFNARHQNWDEFRWEEEIRQDERRISGYFRELASCLDLPDEDELIFEQLAGRSDLVVADTPETIRNMYSGEDEDEEQEEEERIPRRTVETATVDELDMLCAEWNILTAAPFTPAQQSAALGCSCAFAKLLARCADFLEPGEDCSNALIISMGKRTLRDLNETVQFIRRACEIIPERKEQLEVFVSRLGEIRERLISRLEYLR